MGCTYSSQTGDGDGAVRSFRVHNVNEHGTELNRGTIQIRDNHLVLYQKGKEPIRWPLRYLRRYGYDEELFSFESGRRSATGEGIYAFKCVHAADLYTLVQESIQRAGEEEHRSQQSLNQQLPTPVMQRSHNNSAARHTSMNTTRQVPSEQPESYGHFLPNGRPHSRISQQNGGPAELYVNSAIMMDSGHEYVNTGGQQRGSTGGAFAIDQTAALIEFLHHPPGSGGPNGRSQVSYAELFVPDAPDSMENLLDETGQGAVHNVVRRHIASLDSQSRLSQPSLRMGEHSSENFRYSLPIDPAVGNLDTDSVLQSADSDVFISDPPGDTACLNYVNIHVDDCQGASASVPTHGGASGQMAQVSAPPPTWAEISLPPTEESMMTYINLQLQPPRCLKPIKPVNYIVIDHKNQNGDSGACGGAANNSPTSPTSNITYPESPNRKTDSYAVIDLERTQALSNTTRPIPKDDEGGRKTRHNSTISDMP